MHVLGKVLLFLTIVAAAAATAFTARMIQVRNSWMKQAETLKAENEQYVRDIAAEEAELERLQRELNLMLLNWGTPVSGFTVTQASPSVVTVPIGTRHGVPSGQNRQPAGQNPMLYAFRPDSDGSGMIWVGSFYAQRVADAETDLVPTWTVRAGEADPWSTPGTRWRVWPRLPSAAVTRFGKLQQALIAADEQLSSKNNYLQVQQGLLDDANRHNRLRREELLGPPNPPAPPAELEDMEYSHGLLAAIAAEDEARNTAEAEVDRLRRVLKRSYQTLDVYRSDNVELVKELPQPPTDVAERTP